MSTGPLAHLFRDEHFDLVAEVFLWPFTVTNKSSNSVTLLIPLYVTSSDPVRDSALSYDDQT